MNDLGHCFAGLPAFGEANATGAASIVGDGKGIYLSGWIVSPSVGAAIRRLEQTQKK